MIEDVVVVGSGPSGIAAAAAAIECGLRPVLIDGGRRADTQARALQRLTRLGLAREQQRRSEGYRRGLGHKTWFGSSAATADGRALALDYANDVTARSSLATGGLSRIWGATFSFYESRARWPVGTEPEDRDIAAIRALVPSSETSWDESAQKETVRGAPASARVLKAFVANGGRDAWDIMPSRLAIDSSPRGESSCRACGKCLSGCPWDSIWFAGDTVAAWSTDGRIDHRPGLVATTVAESPRGVRIQARDAQGGRREIQAARVFLACGPLATAAIAIRSGIAREVTIADSATAFAALVDPMPRRMTQAHRHSLSQWWARDRGQHGAMVQVYAPDIHHGDLIVERSRGLLPGAVARKIAGHLHPLIAYLDSDDSSWLRMVRGPSGRIRVQAGPNEKPERLLRDALQQFASPLKKSGYRLLQSGISIPPAGAGYHFGASFPMGQGSDSLGRPSPWTRTHIVDASVLPHIEVGSITPTVMANAFRIARVALTRG